MILYGNDLIKKIRTEFDKATQRIWIVVPFIGNWESVKKIMGTRWINNETLDVKLLTDIKNEGFINPETIKQFLHKGNVKTLDGLHAKIYILDNSVFITSANLTGTAFSKRHEICEYFEIESEHEILTVFDDWWKKSKVVKSSWQPKESETSDRKERDAGNTNGLKVLWKLPENTIKIRNFKDYQDNIVLYNHFMRSYENIGSRILNKLSSYHELDAFLNFLFHEQDDTPSHFYLDKPYRPLTEKQQLSEIKKYKSEFRNWINNNKDFEDYRVNRVKVLQKKLDIAKIDEISKEDIIEVVDVLHTMNSHALNRYKFLNPKNNDLKTIKKSFKILLYGNQAIEERMEICNTELKSFGKSSIRELVSWYYPDKYPIMNRNSNSGLKFLGYNIKTY